MKARIKGTDAVISVQPIYSVDGLRIEQFVHTANGDLFQPHTIDIIPNDTDWEALRNQAAIAAMQAALGNSLLVAKIQNIANDTKMEIDDTLVKFCVETADALIRELRKEK